MRVLLLGVTGRVGSRLLPALVAHNHSVVAYVRNPSKLSPELKSQAAAVVAGSGTDSPGIKAAILDNHCDAVVNAAGLAPMFGKSGELPSIFQSVVTSAIDAGKERGGPPLRCWFLSGWSLLDSPKKPYLIIDYVPLYPLHRGNYEYIQGVQSDRLAWSLFCASNMPPRSETIDMSPTPGQGANNLQISADAPPGWSSSMSSVPLVGTYLNIMAQAQSYYTPLEDCVDFIASDLAKGLESPLIGKRVGVKSRSE